MEWVRVNNSTPPAAPTFFALLATGSAFSLTPIWQPCGRFVPQADQGAFLARRSLCRKDASIHKTAWEIILDFIALDGAG